MDSKGLRQYISVLMGIGLGAISLAQESASDRQVQGQVQRPSVFGTQTNILQIPASSFVPLYSITTIGFAGDGYVFKSAGPSPQFAWATVTLPSGVDLDFLDLYYCDLNAEYDLTASLIGYSGWNSANRDTTILIEVSSFGSAACDYRYAPGAIRPDGIIPPGFDHTINNDVRYNGGYQYTIVITSPVDGASLSFKGVDIWYHRQVSPAPGTASFLDVPTSHQFFRFIEALYDSGITAGCQASPLMYCPAQSITRGEMAVFLAKALGLHFPN